MNLIAKYGVAIFSQSMASKVTYPANNLGPFLTSKNISSVDVYARTGISTVELSQLRKGTIKGIDAKKLYLIAKVGKISINDMLIGVYPNLNLNPTANDDNSRGFQSLAEFFDHIDKNVIKLIAEKTGITVYRIKNIRAGKVNPDAHELYLIEMATKIKPGTLFNILFKDLTLNSPEEEERLRGLEKLRSRKSS